MAGTVPAVRTFFKEMLFSFFAKAKNSLGVGERQNAILNSIQFQIQNQEQIFFCQGTKNGYLVKTVKKFRTEFPSGRFDTRGLYFAVHIVDFFIHEPVSTG